MSKRGTVAVAAFVFVHGGGATAGREGQRHQEQHGCQSEYFFLFHTDNNDKTDMILLTVSVLLQKTVTH